MAEVARLETAGRLQSLILRAEDAGEQVQAGAGPRRGVRSAGPDPDRDAGWRSTGGCGSLIGMPWPPGRRPTSSSMPPRPRGGRGRAAGAPGPARRAGGCRAVPAVQTIRGDLMQLVPVGDVFAKVDDAKYELVAQYSWHKYTQRCGPGGCFTCIYARRRWMEDGKRRSQAMHNLIMGCLGVDHWDHDGLNNQVENLRIATNGQNQAHRRTISVYRGIYLTRSGWWVARIRTPQVVST